MYLTTNSDDWQNLLFNLQFSKSKSNRDVLCAICWEIITYEQREKHLMASPSHKDEVLTSKSFCNEEKFVFMAERYGRAKEFGGIIYYENPYKRKMRRKREVKE